MNPESHTDPETPTPPRYGDMRASRRPPAGIAPSLCPSLYPSISPICLAGINHPAPLPLPLLLLLGAHAAHSALAMHGQAGEVLGAASTVPVVVALTGASVAFVGLVVTWSRYVRNPTYSALLALSCFLVTLTVAAFLVAGDTAARQYAHASRRLNQSTLGTFVIDFEDNIPGGELEDMLNRIQYSAKASGFDYMVRRTACMDLAPGTGKENTKAMVVGLEGSLPPGDGWKEPCRSEVFLTESLAARLGWQDRGEPGGREAPEEVLIQGEEYSVSGILNNPIPLLNPLLQEELLSFDLWAWDAYVAMDMEEWASILGDEKSVLQIVIRDMEQDDPSFYPDRNPLYSTLKEIKDQYSAGWGVEPITDWRWYLPRPQSGELFRLLSIGISSIALLAGAAGIMSCTSTILLLRTREIGVMRSVGGDVGQVRGLFLKEIGLLALTGGLPGAIGGVMVSLPIMERLQMEVTLATMIAQGGIAFSLCIAVALAVSSLSFLRVGRQRPAEVIRWSAGFALR